MPHESKPFPEEYIYDPKDLPEGSRWNIRKIIGEIEAGKIPSAFVSFFDRDPERHPPIEPAVVVSPADGILEIQEAPDWTEFTVHLRLTDVHIQRVPFSGVVRSVKCLGRDFYYPDHPNYPLGVRTVTEIESTIGLYTVLQMTTLITKRIETFVVPGQPVNIGDRLGRIRLGSTVILRIPGARRATAESGQKVFGGETILASLSGQAREDI